MESAVSPEGAGAAAQAVPRIVFGYGLSGGSLSVMLADGTRMEGTFTTVSSPSVGAGCDDACAGALAAFARADISDPTYARPGLAVATDGRGNAMVCNVAFGIGVHGAGLCRLILAPAKTIAFSFRTGGQAAVRAGAALQRSRFRRAGDEPSRWRVGQGT